MVFQCPDEAVVESIFNCCDKAQTGYVRASVLVDFLLKYASESHEIRYFYFEIRYYIIKHHNILDFFL